MENVRLTAVAWRAPSLRGRVAFLAATVVVLLSVTLLILVWVLGSSQANLVAQSNKHLKAVVHSLANAYATRPDRAISLTATETLPPHPGFGLAGVEGEAPPPPLPDAPPLPKAPALPKPPLKAPAMPAAAAQLTALTSRVLADETGIE